jgi:myo-inositol-hexaphosphate 3-phosphohydrolase
VEVSTLESDGSDITSAALGAKFPNGLFVAMSTDKTFHFYDWADIAGSDLKILNK